MLSFGADSLKLKVMKLLLIQEFLATSFRILGTIVFLIYVPFTLMMVQRARSGATAFATGTPQPIPLEPFFVLTLSLVVAVASHFWLKRILKKRTS